jgi:hypothetical protein
MEGQKTMGPSFRDQIVQRLQIHLGEVDVPVEELRACASDVIYLLEQMMESRQFDSAVRQIIQRYADEWSEHSSRRLLETQEDGAADVVYEMLERQGRTRALRALRRVMLDLLEGKERPLDDLGFFEDGDD